MSEPMSRLEQARVHVDPTWDETRVRAELGKLEQRMAARSRARFAWWSLGIGVAAAAALVVWQRTGDVAQQANGSVAPRTREAPMAPPPAAGPDMKTAPDERALAVLPSAPTLLSDGGAQIAPDPTSDSPRRMQTRRHVVAAAEWRRLAEEGRYKEAFAALPTQTLKPAGLDVPGLLLAADTARLSGHPAEAVPYYREIFERSPSDSRAHLAAFTLGRTLLNELRDPRAAAAAFGRAYALAPRSPLAEEALVRQVESLARAQDMAAAQERAAFYLATFPNGRRVQEVRRAAKLP